MLRGSGIPPANDQDRKKEVQKINDYKNLVETVNLEVLAVLLNPNHLAKLHRYVKNATPAKLSTLPPSFSNKTPSTTRYGTIGASYFVNF